MTVDPDEQPTLNLLDDILGNIYTSTQQSRKDFVRKDYSKPRRRRQAIESTDVSSVALSRSSSARAPLLSGDEDEETKPTSYSARERSSICPELKWQAVATSSRAVAPRPLSRGM